MKNVEWCPQSIIAVVKYVNSGSNIQEFTVFVISDKIEKETHVSMSM